MEHVKVRGIILRTTDYREADRIIDILTAELGMVTATARGARRQKSPLLPTTQALGFCDFELYRNVRTGMFTVDSTSRVTDFRRIREDVERLVCAAHLAELMGDAARDDHPETSDLFRLLAVSLAALDREDRDPLVVVRAFEIRLMCILGFMPVLDACAVCGGDLSADGSKFGFSVCGVVCGAAACQARAGERMFATSGALSCMRYLRDAPIDRLFSFRLERRDFDSLSKISERFVSEQMEKRYGRLDLLAKLQPKDTGSAE